jgi:hypothetical protein
LAIVPGGEIKARLIAMLRSWVEAVITSSSGKRCELNEVSNAIGRFGFRELLPELKRLLDEDLARLRKARDGFMDARRRGDIEATSDASMRYGNQYRDAFVRLGGEDAAGIASDYLEDRVFGFDAALILKAISDKQLNIPEPGINRRWPWFDEVAGARAARVASPRSEPADGLSAPIFAAIDRLAKPETDKEGQLLAIALARIALAMPHPDQDALIARVAALPQPLNSKRELFAAVVMDGQLPDAEVIMQAVEEWLAEASKNEQTAWHKKQNTWEIEPWLELLPFSTRPEDVIDGLAKVKAFYGSGWAQHWERVLAAVGAVPGPEGEGLLANLARNHRDIADDLRWMNAILRRDSAPSVLLYVDLLTEGVLGQGPHPVGAWRSGRELATYVRKFPELRAELKKRYAAASTGRARDLLEGLFGEIGDGEDLIAMIEKFAASGEPYDGRMDAVVRVVAVRNEPVAEGSSSYYVLPVPVARLRKTLFGLRNGNANEAALATRCLIAIDLLRDEEGIAANDNRHPDVLSERPWPPEAGLPS